MLSVKKIKRFRGNTQCNIEDIDYCNVILTQERRKGNNQETLCCVSLLTRQALHCFLKCLLQAAFSMGLCPVLQIDKHICMALRGQNKGMSLLSIRKPPATSYSQKGFREPLFSQWERGNSSPIFPDQ